MQIIIITSPEFISGEASYIIRLLDNGASLIHIRKPQCSLSDIENLICSLPASYYDRIIIHDHFELCEKYKLCGIHLNSRSNIIPHDFHGTISCSCHSLDEVRQKKQDVNYLFLSPIFDSISKVDYKAAFPLSDLQNAAISHLIDNKVIALGGITKDRLEDIKTLGFGGVALLGNVWNRINDGNIDEVCRDLIEMRKK